MRLHCCRHRSCSTSCRCLGQCTDHDSQLDFKGISATDTYEFDSFKQSYADSNNIKHYHAVLLDLISLSNMPFAGGNNNNLGWSCHEHNGMWLDAVILDIKVLQRPVKLLMLKLPPLHNFSIGSAMLIEQFQLGHGNNQRVAELRPDAYFHRHLAYSHEDVLSTAIRDPVMVWESRRSVSELLLGQLLVPMSQRQ